METFVRKMQLSLFEYSEHFIESECIWSSQLPEDLGVLLDKRESLTWPSISGESIIVLISIQRTDEKRG